MIFADFITNRKVNMRFIGILMMMCLVVLVGCTGDEPSSIALTDVPVDGDPVRGEELFNTVSPVCSSCHMEDNASASPDLTGYGDVAGTRVEGESAREYTFHAITEPGRFVVEGYGNAMPASYDDDLNPQDIADLIAYLLGL